MGGLMAEWICQRCLILLYQYSFRLLFLSVGFPQMSLGDVYAEEAALPLSSGVKAKREMERKTKSYFKGSGGTIESFDDD